MPTPGSSNNVLARLRLPGRVLNPLHLDATTSYQKSKPEGGHHHHDHHYRKEEGEEKKESAKEKEHVRKQQQQHGYTQAKQYKSYKNPHKAQSVLSTYDNNNNANTNTGRPAQGFTDVRTDFRAEGFGERKVSFLAPARRSPSTWLTERQARNKHLLVPKRRVATSSAGVKDRKKHPKLVGADLYVARIANDAPHAHSSKKPPTPRRHRPRPPDAAVSGSGPSASPRSLHDELTCKTQEVSVPSPLESQEPKNNRVVAESRPCYRCVSYMHSVGIRRVFWTTNEGKWDGAKVRDLVDQLEGAMATSDSTLGLPIPSLFVTKHEVLLLRRLMGGND